MRGRTGLQADRVSVIVPTYNRAYCLRETLDSVIAQTYTDWELLVVDDGSTDGTRELIAEWYGDEPRVVYLHQENAGVSAARNRGIAEAQGKFVAFLDSDDLWKPWKLEAQIACLAHLPEVGMVWTDMEAIDPEDQVVDPRHLKTMYNAYRYFDVRTLFERTVDLTEMTDVGPAERVTVRVGDIYGAMIMGNLVHTSTVLLRRSRLEQVGGFEEDLKISGEDYDFHLRTCRYGPVALLDVAAIQYRKGRSDHLSRNSRWTAVNFLTTVERAVQQDAGIGRFEPARVDRVLRGAHSWVAEEYFQSGEHRASRRHALASLARKKAQGRVLLLLGFSFVPAGAIRVLRRSLQALRGQRQTAG